jgi:hypothetical protein
VIQSEAAAIVDRQSEPPEPELDPALEPEPPPESELDRDDSVALLPDLPAAVSPDRADAESPEPPADSDEDGPSPDGLFDSVGSPARDAALLLAPELRSFLAQPDPLKTIAGGANPFRIVPSAPHSGQNRGPSSLIPWRMSVLCPHAVHAYS